MRRAGALTRSRSLEAKSVESSPEINIGAIHEGYEREGAFDKSGEDHEDVTEGVSLRKMLLKERRVRWSWRRI